MQTNSFWEDDQFLFWRFRFQNFSTEFQVVPQCCPLTTVGLKLRITHFSAIEMRPTKHLTKWRQSPEWSRPERVYPSLLSHNGFRSKRMQGAKKDWWFFVDIGVDHIRPAKAEWLLATVDVSDQNHGFSCHCALLMASIFGLDSNAIARTPLLSTRTMRTPVSIP